MPTAISNVAIAEAGRTQLLGLVRHRDRVQVDHAVEAVVRVLVAHPMPERTQQVAQVRDAGRLDAGEDAFTCR